MFEQSFLNSGRKGKRALSLLTSCAAQIAIVGLMLIVPLLYTDRLPAYSAVNLILPPLPPVAGVEHTPRQPELHRASAGAARPLILLEAPVRIPSRVTLMDDSSVMPSFTPSIGQSVPNGIGAIGGGVEGGIELTPFESPAPPPAQPQPLRTIASKPVPVGGDVQQAKLVRQPLPVYPQLAIQTRTSGVVKLIGIIGKDGSIRQLKVLSGHPLLIPAAIEAVRRWLYRPTLLNGEPVEVIAPIDVHFKLNN